MPPKPARVLLVEGPDDREVIYQLCNYYQLDNRKLFEVIAKEGYEKLRDDLEVRPEAGDIEAIGAIVDADVNLEQRWQSLRGALGACGYQGLPSLPEAGGTLIAAQGPLPRVGIWVMPDNRFGGMLEDFMQRLIRQGDSLIPQAQAVVSGLPESERRFKPSYHSKAVIHTWLAWQEEPGTPLGQAVTRRYLNADHELAQQFLAWLKNLFSSAPAAQ